MLAHWDHWIRTATQKREGGKEERKGESPSKTEAEKELKSHSLLL